MPEKKIASLLALGLSLCLAMSGNATAAGMGADRHIELGLKCESCHGPEKKIETPEKAQCLQCHDAKKIAEKTKGVKPHNPHDSPHYHQDLDCTLCHVQHGVPENYCAQCHKFDYKVK